MIISHNLNSAIYVQGTLKTHHVERIDSNKIDVQKKYLILSMLHLFIAEIRSKFSQLLNSSITFKIFSKCLTPREQQKLVLICFNLENILSSLALETESVNKNLIINTMWL